MMAKIQLPGSHFGLTAMLLMVIVACTTDSQLNTPTQIADAGVNTTDQPTFIPEESQQCELVNVTGEVEIFPADSSSSQIATDTRPVQCGDEILLRSGAAAELHCSDLDSHYLVAGITHTVNCTPNGIPTTLCYATQGCRGAWAAQGVGGFGTGQGVGGPEREEFEMVPYIIEPRATLLLEQPTILRWNPVEGASEYEVTVRGGDLKWVTTTTESAITYTGDPLQPGVNYTFEVTTLVTDDTGESLHVSSQDEGKPGLGFALLSAEDAAHFQQSFENIQQASLSPTERTIAEYNLYLSYSLNSAAIRLLSRTVDSGEVTSVLLQLQGQAYQNVALLTEAESTYSLALEQAIKMNDLNVIGQSNAALGLLLCGTDDVDRVAEGVEYLETAVSTYEQLEYDEEINRLNQEVETCQFSDN